MKLNNLQILRGISALLVCCFHFRKTINIPGMYLGNILFAHGHIGVPVFFIISGFIITFTTQKINFSKISSQQITLFYKKRVIRVVPLYYILTFAVCFLYPQWPKLYEFIHTLLFLPTKEVYPILEVGWSLNFEMFFYLIFGVSLLFKEKRYYFIIGFFILTSGLGYFVHFDNPFWLMISNPLNHYFVMGILFALLLNKYTIPKNWATVISVIGIISFILLLLSIIPLNNNWVRLPIISLFVFSFLIFDFVFHLKGNRFLIFLGDISYSFYLSHPFVKIILKKLKIEVEGYFNLPYFLFEIILAIALASFLYYFVEKKITQYLKIKLKA